MRKRTTAILLTAAMTAGMLAGCGGSQGPIATKTLLLYSI